MKQEVNPIRFDAGGEEITFSEYRPEDFDGFYSCLHTFFLDGYPYTEYLQKDSLQAILETGDLIITVAKNRAGAVIATTAARCIHGENGSSVFLLLRRVADGYKMKGIATAQETYLLDLIRERFPDALSISAEVVTHRDHSQVTLSRRGFSFCGLCLTLYHSKVLMPKLEFPPHSRMTLAIYEMPLAPHPVTVYAPPEHRAYIEGVYHDLGVPCSIREEDSVPAEPLCYHIDRYAAHQAAELFIDRCGVPDETFERDIRALIDGGYTVVAFVSLCQNGCSELYRTLRRLRFRFSGMKPCVANGELMILSNTENYFGDFKDLVLPPDKEAILRYILEEEV